jgi:hypothetical protein
VFGRAVTRGLRLQRYGVSGVHSHGESAVKGDRFIAGDWNTETYSEAGMQGSGMKDVLGRHFPELVGVLGESGDAFAPWKMVGKRAEYKVEETNA